MRKSFNYIYYRMTKFYFKWDGRTGITGIIGVSMIQVVILADIFMFVARLNFTRLETAPYAKIIASIFSFLAFVIIFLNYRKYDGSYNKFRFQWKDETDSERFNGAILILLALAIPWMPIILIGVYW